MIINNLKLLQFDSLNLGDNNLRDYINFLPVGLYTRSKSQVLLTIDVFFNCLLLNLH